MIVKRILCPTDLSSAADEALRYAVALSCAYEAKLLLLYCTELRPDRNRHENEDLQSETAALF